jgi:protease-4
MLAKALNINQDRIAIVELFGAIPSSAKTAEYVRRLKAIEENAHIRALVVDIDCPGGGASASEYLYRAIAKVKTQKPVVAFIRGTGASGGYMAGCAATKVLAAPMAIVGSIGVISMRPMLYELLAKVGVRMEITKSGRLKDMFSNFREPTDEERVKEQALLDAFYDRFVEIVAEARGMPAEQVRALATGEIYTAAQAKANGLIDELGDLDAAIDLAQGLSGMAERKITYARPRRGLRERLLSGTAASLGGGIVRAVEGALLERRVEYR